MLLKKSVIAAVAVATLTVSAAFATVPAQTNACNYQFATNLRLGAVSSDVQNLQKLLNMDAATRVAVSGAGSMGAETFRFGPATMAAVKKFQAANGISPVSGYVGPLTRATLNTICSSTVSNTTPTTNTGSGVVSNNIPVSVLVQKQANAKLAEFVVSGNGTVTGIELMRTGLSNNATLKNVFLYDGATRLTSGSSVLTDGTIRFTSSSGLFPVSGSKTITVRADIENSTSGQTVGVAMKSVTMMGGTATPVTGANGPLFSISSASLGGANLTTTSPSPSNTTINAGSMNQTIWSNNLNVSTNAQKLHGLTLKMIGSAPMNTLANVKLYVDGVERGMSNVNNMGQFVFNMSGSPVMLNTGSHFIELRADVVAGANRNFYVALEEATDLMVEDSTLPGTFITPTYLSGNLVNILGGTVTVNAGSLTINQDTAFNNTTTLVSGATNVKMAAYKFTSYGEDVKVNTLTFSPQFTGAGASTTMVNVGLYVNGGQVGSNQTATHNTNLVFNNLGTNLLVQSGQTVVVEIRGDVVNGSNLAIVNPQVVQFNLVAGSNNAQGVSSSNLASTAGSSGQTLTVASSNVTFAVAAGSANSTKAPNQSGIKIGSFTMQTGSAEGVTVTQVAVTIAGTMQPANQLTNLTVKDGSTVIGTPIGNPITGVNNFSANVSVPMSTTKTFDVYADFGSASAGQTVTPSVGLTIRGNTSNLTTTVAATTGVQTTSNVAVIGVGDITFKASSFPAATFLIGGGSNVAVGSFNVKSSGISGGVIKDVTFTVPSNTVSSITANGKTAAVVGTTATIYDLGLAVPSDASGVDVPVTVNLVCVNTTASCAGVANSNVTVTWGATTYNNGSTVVGPFTPTLAVTLTNKLVSTKPVVTMSAMSSTGLVNGINKIGTFTVAADASGDVKLEQIPVNTTRAGCTSMATVELRDADGNNIISGTSAVAEGAQNIAISPARTITKGTSETYSVYATLGGCSGNAGTQSASFTLGAKASFLWTDVLGNITGITGANFTSYPNVSQTKTN